MARGYLKEFEYRETDIANYIVCLMRREHKTQKIVASKIGTTQPYFSHKLKNASFTTHELLTIFKLLNADSEVVGKLFTFERG